MFLISTGLFLGSTDLLCRRILLLLSSTSLPFLCSKSLIIARRN
jgi:hypothetical protein